MSTPEGQLNRNMAILTRFLMQKQLMGQRMGGYGQLETQRHENMMTRMKAEFTDQLSRDPVMQRHRALVFKARQEGKDVASLIEAMRKDALNLTKVSFATSTQKPWTEETAQAATMLTESAMTEMIGQAAMGERQVRDITAVQIPGLKLRAGELGAEKERIRLKEDELKLEWQKLKQKPAEEQNKEMRAIVKDTINFLEAEGVKGADVNEQMRALFGSGKVPDPLSPENRGKAFTYLMEIWIKLAKGKALTANEEKFLINVRNTRAIQPTAGIAGLPEVPEAPGVPEELAPGGLISPRTGLTPGQEVGVTEAGDQVINQRLLEMMTQMYMEEGKLDEATARQMAQKLLGQLR